MARYINYILSINWALLLFTICNTILETKQKQNCTNINQKIPFSPFPFYFTNNRNPGPLNWEKLPFLSIFDARQELKMLLKSRILVITVGNSRCKWNECSNSAINSLPKFSFFLSYFFFFFFLYFSHCLKVIKPNNAWLHWSLL